MLMDNNSPNSVSRLVSWSTKYLISQSDELIKIPIEMINIMNNIF